MAANAAGKIDEAIAVDIFEHGAFAFAQHRWAWRGESPRGTACRGARKRLRFRSRNAGLSRIVAIVFSSNREVLLATNY